ncbi:NAD-dependent epimerase/dehydratase family protein [Candidatus Micrarchaeota archaeon]|nr:NAD-dependent epimerase/dehydratase family protein [Candidatus Micrarchaeota archaeon]
MKVLVTGGCGFIGSHLTEKLLREGHEVIVLDDLSTGREANLPKSATLIKGSFGNTPQARLALSEVDAIYHLGAVVGVRLTEENPWKVLETNNYKNHEFFDLVRKSSAKKLIFASSSEVYGNSLDMPLSENDGLKAITPYQTTKLIGETYTRELYENYGIDSCAIRYFNVYGPRQQGSAYGFVVSIFIKNALAGKPLEIFGDGNQTRDFTFIDDAVNAKMLMLKKKLGGISLNIGTGRETRIMDLANEIIKIAGSKSKIVHLKEKPGEIARRLADISFAKKHIGFLASVKLEEGLLRTIRTA